MREKAENYFHGKEKYNCAQAILKTFQERYDVDEATIISYKKFGGGRAEHNTCGALYAAQKLVRTDEEKEIITKAFSTEASSPRCKDIRKNKVLSCRECVGVTAEILERLHRNN